MYTKTLQTYSLIQSFWSNGIDSIEIYALMTIKLLKSQNGLQDNTIVTPEILKKFFEEEYGISNLSLGAASTILKRLVKKQVLYRDNHGYFTKKSELVRYSKNLEHINSYNISISEILDDIKRYASEDHDTEFEGDQVEKALLDFFQRYDGEIATDEWYIGQKNKTGKKQTKSQKSRYIIAKYILSERDKGSEKFEALVDFSIGHMVANWVSMDSMVRFDGSLKNLSVYFDTPLVYCLINLSDSIEAEMIKELIKRLRELKVRLVMANEHYQEIVNGINFAIGLLKSDTPDLSKTNRVYMFARQHGLEADDLEVAMHQAYAKINNLGITIESTDCKGAGYSETKEADIKKSLTEAYTRNGEMYLIPRRVKTVDRDAKVLARVFRMRDDIATINLRECKAVMVTNNLMLCKVGQELSKNIGDRFPACVSTEFLSTILWGNRPADNQNLNKLKLISECMQTVTLKPGILRHFYADLKAKYGTHGITDEQFYDISTSRLLDSMLLEVTCNSYDGYTDETMQEVSERILAKRNSMLMEKDDKIAEVTKRKKAQEAHIDRRSTQIARIVIAIIWMIVVGVLITTKFWKNGKYPILDWAFRIVGVFFMLWGLLSWIGFIPKKVDLTIWLSSKIAAWFKPKNRMANE